MSALYRWCFTLNETAELSLDDSVRVDVQKLLQEHSSKWCFQLEKGEETGKLHYQGRLALPKKLRLKGLVELFNKKYKFHWSQEHDKSASSLYVCKDGTRVEGPWRDPPVVQRLPRQIRDLELKGWQCDLKAKLEVFDTRRIHFVLDKNGGIGKSTFVTYMSIKHKACLIPQTCQTADDMMQYACSMVKQQERYEDWVFMLDVPRSVIDKAWGKWLACLESLKNGHIYDHRYKATEIWIDCPGIVVFANEAPPSNMLTSDRWVVMNPNRYDEPEPCPLIVIDDDVIIL